MATVRLAARPSFAKRVGKGIRDRATNWELYIMLLPALVYIIIFAYKPMYGVIIAFKNFSPGKGIVASEWVGLKHFLSFFKSYYFGRLLRNTLTISLSSLIFGFPMPIIFALLLNEVHNSKFKRTIQTITYMPHFISLVVMCSLIRLFVADTGIIVQLMAKFGFEPVALLSKKEYFVPIYVLSGIWQGFGWDSIIYLSALTAIDPGLYEAATIDGANRWKQTIHVTLPGIRGIISIQLILTVGKILNVSFGQIFVLISDLTLDVGETIDYYVYRVGLGSTNNMSLATASGMFKSIIGLMLIVLTNYASRKLTDGEGIW